jgi:hypothetical protein
MKPRSSYKIRRTGRPFDDYLDGVIRAQRRADRIVESLRSDIVEGGAGQSLRIRQVFQNPREIYRIELEVPEMSYQRTTLLDRDALEELLEADEVRAILVGEA